MKGLSLRMEHAIVNGSTTAAEIAERLDHPLHTVQVVLSQLAREGRVCRSGHRGQKNANFPVIVWSVVGRVRGLERA